MEINAMNRKLLLGEISPGMLPHLDRLQSSAFIFHYDFGLEVLPEEPGVLLIRGPRQYGKSTWLEQQLFLTVQSYGAGTAFYINGDFLSDVGALDQQLQDLAMAFPEQVPVKRIFIDEITAIDGWEQVIKRLVDNGVLRDVLLVTTGSKATDLRRGAERLPGRKGRLSRTNYAFTPVAYPDFYAQCHEVLQERTLPAYMISGGSPLACSELASHGRLPEYLIQLARDWVEGEFAKARLHRTSLFNVIQVLFRFGGSSVGQAKLAREASLANNTVAKNYIELLNDLGCVVPSYPIHQDQQTPALRKPCKYHYTNLLMVSAYHPSAVRTPEDFLTLPPQQQAMWYEWLLAQELQRRHAILGHNWLAPLSFWQSQSHEIDFYDQVEGFIEMKRGKASPLDFSWFAKHFPGQILRVFNQHDFATPYVKGVTLEDFLLGKK